MSTFQGFPKIARLSRDCIVTEKIDGTNAQILITTSLADMPQLSSELPIESVTSVGELHLIAGSRTRFIAPGKSDNHGFAAWVKANAEELVKLGPGRHFGEWWGSGIQRGYGLPKGEKRFSLFNTSIWADDAVRPACCSVVPVLYRGTFDTQTAVDEMLELLMELGSIAAPGFMKPEGIIVYHVAGNLYFKKTIEKDAEHKGIIV